jgi:hypothetical protein
MSLEKIQEDFIAAFFSQNLQDAATHVKGNDTLSAEQRIGIYRGSVHGILTQALETTFPVCKMLLGEKFFNAMCDIFIDTHPPSSPFFADFGAGLGRFLDGFEPAQSVPFVADMARMEWLRKESWNSKPAPASDFTQLMETAESDYATLTFSLNPSLQLFQSNYRIDLLWSAHQYDNQDDIDAALEAINMEESVKLAIWKLTSELAIFDFTKNETLWDFLQAISKQASLEQLAIDFGDKLPAHLSSSIQHGWLQSYQTNNE